jgi:hypothetical protein
VDLVPATHCVLYEIHVLQHAHIDGGNFSCVMATQDMIDLVQRHKVVVACVITIPNSQSFVRAHVEEGEFPIGKFVRTRKRK